MRRREFLMKLFVGSLLFKQVSCNAILPSVQCNAMKFPINRKIRNWNWREGELLNNLKGKLKWFPHQSHCKHLLLNDEKCNITAHSFFIILFIIDDWWLMKIDDDWWYLMTRWWQLMILDDMSPQKMCQKAGRQRPLKTAQQSSSSWPL